MLRNPMIPPKALAPFCHAMARMLEAGVDVRKTLATCVQRASDSRLTRTVHHVADRVKSGNDLTMSFKEFPEHYPRLFLDLLNVGEQTGAMPEVMKSLGDYYEARVKRSREFRSAIAWPMIQLFAAIMIIGLLIILLGWIPNAPDVLGFGLMGSRGAVIWFVITFGSMAGLWFGWTMLTRSLTGQLFLDPMLLKIPGVGGCLRSFAIARFAWCFALTQQAGMSIRPSLTSSLNATANGAFVAAEPYIWNEIHEGETLGDALRTSRLFPDEFLHFVDTAEETGTVPEALDRMSHQFDEEAHRSLQWLTVLLARGIWVLVAMIIIFFIFRLAMFYVDMLNSAVSDPMNF